MSAREEILARISSALGPEPQTVEIPRDYHLAGEVAVPDPTGLLTDRLHDYGAHVRHCAPSDLSDAVGAALAARGARRVVVPAGVPAGCSSVVPEPVLDDPALSTAQLDGVDGVLTTVAVAIAETGTLILDGGPGQGRRALSLVPDYHLAIVKASQIVSSVPDAVAGLEPTSPMTWISGPSATSDIELSRVEGVHGPRTLEVILVHDLAWTTTLPDNNQFRSND